eukprot:TRINITY_DN319_c0_g1_i11.p1 TRINITY_DN319_c0_g1~~TRINITY_DN319_c0_g1_i11.p1  ORF type:complete len:176 (+),score=79.58 TRINITY_DN319_c0_g1_i11:68-595(+)
MASNLSVEEYEKLKKERQFYKFQFRGLELEALNKLKDAEISELYHARARRRMSRGMNKKYVSLMKKVRESKKDVKIGDKPPVIKTHLRNMLIMPEMIGGMIGIYNGKIFNAVEIKGEMLGRYLGEFSLSYKPCLLYTSDAADEEDSVDLGGRRIIKKKKRTCIKDKCVRDNKKRN